MAVVAGVLCVGFAVAAVLLTLRQDRDGASDGPSRDDVGTATSSSAPVPTDPATPRRPLEGFAEAAFRVSSPGEPATTWCALLAESDAARAQGLMEQRDLRGYDGMVFRFPQATTTRFYMRNTPIPLSIAFFDAGGAFVSSTDMVPCPDRAATCPTYAADSAFLHALEVPSGGLDELGVGPGSQLSFPATACPS